MEVHRDPCLPPAPVQEAGAVCKVGREGQTKAGQGGRGSDTVQHVNQSSINSIDAFSWFGQFSRLDICSTQPQLQLWMYPASIWGKTKVTLTKVTLLSHYSASYIENINHYIFNLKLDLDPMDYEVNLCFNMTEKGHLIVPDWCNRILENTRKYCKTVFFNENSMKIWFNIVWL